jgi:Cys-tRNA(Pro) deacylase
MKNDEMPMTQGVRWLRSREIVFTPHSYEYLDRGGTAHSAESLGVAEHAVVKTLIMQDDGKNIFIVLMHGDREVSTKNLARQLGVKQVFPCEAALAQRHTGYQFGGTSPFGTRQLLPVYVEKTILDLPLLYINGGKRGFLVSMTPGELRRALTLIEVAVAIEER